MIRALFSLGSLCCMTLVLAEGVALVVLWSQGALTPATWQEIRLALQGSQTAQSEQDAREPQTQAPSHEEIRTARLTRILQLDARENELKILKRMTFDAANQAFDQLKQQFQADLQRLQEQNRTEAAEQTRAILQATPPEEAVQRLMALSPQEATDLLRGLPEKSIARILQAFQLDQKTAPRGQELFEALYRGDPARALIQNTLDQAPPSPAVSRREG
jgi:flagellar motility protein MotE (MotC chaperone)